MAANGRSHATQAAAMPRRRCCTRSFHRWHGLVFALAYKPPVAHHVCMALPSDDFVSRAGRKLAHALAAFAIDPRDFICADLGSNTGGFVDCLLQRGAARVYAVERGYGVLDFSLRRDARVVSLERTDARRVTLPEPIDLVTIDAGWTRQAEILPAARRLLKPGGRIISLIKPHYEARPDELTGGVLRAECVDSVLAAVRSQLAVLQLELLGEVGSPIQGHGGNREWLWLLCATK